MSNKKIRELNKLNNNYKSVKRETHEMLHELSDKLLQLMAGINL